MNFEDVKTIAANGESDRVEFKSSTGQRTAAVKTVCAMLNGLGGFVIFGFGDKGKIAGQPVAAKTLEGSISASLRRSCANLTNPSRGIPLSPMFSIAPASSNGGAPAR